MYLHVYIMYMYICSIHCVRWNLAIRVHKWYKTITNTIPPDGGTLIYVDGCSFIIHCVHACLQYAGLTL